MAPKNNQIMGQQNMELGITEPTPVSNGQYVQRIPDTGGLDLHYNSDLSLQRAFDVNIPEGPDIIPGMNSADIHEVLRNTDNQLKSSDEVPCAGCARTDLKRSEQVHLAPLRTGTFGFLRVACYDCLQCKGPTGKEPWLWSLDGFGEPNFRSDAATFVPILRMNSKGDPHKHEAIPRQVHKVSEDGSWTRTPFYTGTEEQNKVQFKRDSNKSWFQYALVHQASWRTSTRSMNYSNLADLTKKDHPDDSLPARKGNNGNE